MSLNRRSAAIPFAAVIVVGCLALVSPAQAKKPLPEPGSVPGQRNDVREVGPDLNAGKPLPLDSRSLAAARRRADQEPRQSRRTSVGDSRTFPAYDDVKGTLYSKTYQLQGVGEHIQVWVATDREFPAGDCRNALGLTTVTQAQVRGLIDEFDTNIYPRESAAFSTPPAADGADAFYTELLGLPKDYYQVPASQADDVTVLVDNVRDASFYTPSQPQAQTFIAGFFYSVFDAYLNRNVMTIDSFDWAHRTGAHPPDDSTDPAYVACAKENGTTGPYGLPSPRGSESVFAHEYQHLLEYHVDPSEHTWVNEGLSQYADTLVGYDDTDTPSDVPGANNAIKAFQGFMPDVYGGPGNSLTSWQDQGDAEILADYGATYSLMQYLVDKYGPRIMTALHHDPLTGMASLQHVLTAAGARRTAEETVHDWAAAMALDNAVSRDRRWPAHSRFRVGTLQSSINWDTPQAYSTPGAPPNGSDYVRFRDAKGTYLSARQVRALSFHGAPHLPTTHVEWVVDPAPPAATTATTTCGNVPDGPAEPALYSGCGPNLDRSIARSVTVPGGSPTLSFDALWDTETDFDFGYTDVSDDGGVTWESLPVTDTSFDHLGGRFAVTGDSGSWHHEEADLSQWAGKRILLGFRHTTSPGPAQGGFWVRHIMVGAQSVPMTTTGWRTYGQINPTPVAGWNVRLVGIDAKRHRVHSRLLRLSSSFSGRLSGSRLHRALGRRGALVGAIVTSDDPDETVTQYAPYRLSVNGVQQPGG